MRRGWVVMAAMAGMVCAGTWAGSAWGEMTGEQRKQVMAWAEEFLGAVKGGEYGKASETLEKGLVLTIETTGHTSGEPNLRRAVNEVWAGRVRGPGEEALQKGRECIEAAHERSLAKHPEQKDLYQMLIEFYWQDGKVEKANALLLKALAKSPYNRWMVLPVGGGSDERMMKEYRAALGKNGEDLVSRVRLVLLLERQSQIDEALAEYPEVVKRVEKGEVRFALLMSMGMLYERRRLLKEAVETHEKALEEEGVGPQYRAMVMYRIVRIKREEGDVEGVVKTWEKAIAIQPDVEYACRWRVGLATWCADHDMAGEARMFCNEALALSTSETTRAEAAKLLEKLGEI